MPSNKIHIEKNTVQETLIIPLYGRKMCSERFPKLYKDIFATQLCNTLDYDFSELEKKKRSFFYEFGSLEAAMRQLDIIWEVKNYLKNHPQATIVNLGCGLDETGKACDNGLCRIVNIDFPDVISVREQLIAPLPRETNIACDLKDYVWMEKLDGSSGILFLAAGVFHYFKRTEVEQMVSELAKRFGNNKNGKQATLIFDSVGKIGLKLMMKKILKNMNITDIDGYFYVNHPEKDLYWSDKIKVSSKGYMLGYYDMKLPEISRLHRLLAKFCDKGLKMAINRIEFV